MFTRSVLAGAVLCFSAWAQTGEPALPPLNEPEAGTFAIAFQSQKLTDEKAAADAGNVLYVRTEVAGSADTVKGAPFSADTVSEFTQTLADGNVIRRKETGSLCRDSEGRTRRVQSLGQIGPLPGPEEPVQLIFINDPVAGVSYVLNTKQKTAEKLPMPPKGAGPGVAMSISSTMAGPGTISARAGTAARAQTIYTTTRDMVVGDSASTGAQTETKVIEGLQATGNRTTHTIAAGAIGNDRPIETISERWYSSDLQTVLMTRHSDPRMGDNTYRLTNINRAEPAHALFEVPSDYTLTEGPQNVQLMKQKHEAEILTH